MTFSHGDYAKIDAIPDKMQTAEKLFIQSLSFHPDHRAYLGLGILYQQQHLLKKSIEILYQGLDNFDCSMELNVCQGINYLNLGKHEKALPFFLKFEKEASVKPYISRCYEAMAAERPIKK